MFFSLPELRMQLFHGYFQYNELIKVLAHIQEGPVVTNNDDVITQFRFHFPIFKNYPLVQVKRQIKEFQASVANQPDVALDPELSFYERLLLVQNHRYDQLAARYLVCAVFLEKRII